MVALFSTEQLMGQQHGPPRRWVHMNICFTGVGVNFSHLLPEVTGAKADSKKHVSCLIVHAGEIKYLAFLAGVVWCEDTILAELTHQRKPQPL